MSIPVALFDKVFHNQVKPVGVGKGVARLHQQVVSLAEGQLQGDGKGYGAVLLFPENSAIFIMGLEYPNL